MPDITNVTVLGTGVLGSQIAYQSAYHGKRVVAYDIDEAALSDARGRLDGLASTFRDEVDGATEESTREARDRITLTDDLAAAVGGAELVIEAVPEKLELKRDVYERLAGLAPAETIFATNSSTLLPSDLADATGRPERFLALHFANQIWRLNTAEVMGTERTDPDVFDTVVGFAESIGMVPIELKKEKAGYVLNSLLVPFLSAAGALLVGGYADHETIDKTWRIGTGAPLGPFQIYDVVGLETAYNISSAGDETQQRFAEYLKENYIDQGKLGQETGEGFYRYPAE